MKKVAFFFGTIALMGLVSFLYSQTPAEPKDNRTDTGERTKILIDFNQYEKRNSEEGIYPEKNPEGWENNPTLYPVTQKDMDLNHWVVRFNSSSNTYDNKKFSYTKRVQTKDGQTTVLGARIHFPRHSFASHAAILPPYEIMEFNDAGKMANIANGVIANVHQFKSVSVEVSGRNYRHRLSLRLIDRNQKLKSFFLGYLNFAGWRRLVWENPYYISDVDQRSLFRPKLYPHRKNYYKFHSFVVSRPGNGSTGDYVVYFKKVEVNYDLYALADDALTIDDENTWQIHKREQKVREAHMKKVNSNVRELRNFELKRMGNNHRTPQEVTEGKKSESVKPTSSNN